ncbi:MAG TPA: uroporphyrinogen-III synthase, partial [Deltaproteobacteria bacterium]|nr:uroporphyrinogen-III synthase [Deltaproteobacteria bacterium]
VLYPLIEISPLPFDLPDIASCDMLIFTSQNAVPLFLDRMFASNLDARALAGKEVLCIGPKTREALRSYGIVADAMAEEYRAEGIVEVLKNKDLKGKKVCLPRAREARTYLVDALKGMGADVIEIPVYGTVLPENADRESFLSAVGEVDTVIFTSPSGVRHALTLLGNDTEPLKGKTLAAIGPVTASAMERLHVPAHVVADEYTDEGIIEALKGESE